MKKINFIGKNRPLCKDDFIENLIKSDRPASCKYWINKVVEKAEKNVWRIACDKFSVANAIFLSNSVWITNAHRFFNYGLDNLPKSKKTLEELSNCYLEKFDPAQNKYIRKYVDAKEPNSLNIGQASVYSQDYAVGKVREPIDGVLPLDDMIGGSIGAKDELVFASAATSFKGVRDCKTISVTSCSAVGPIVPQDDDLNSTTYITDCPAAPASSGSPVFVLRKNSSGECTGANLGAIHITGSQKQPDGSDFHFSEDGDDPKSMWSVEVGIDNKISGTIKQVLGIVGI